MPYELQSSSDWTKVSYYLLRGSISVFLIKPKVTCKFSGGQPTVSSQDLPILCHTNEMSFEWHFAGSFIITHFKMLTGSLSSDSSLAENELNWRHETG